MSPELSRKDTRKNETRHTVSCSSQVHVFHARLWYFYRKLYNFYGRFYHFYLRLITILSRYSFSPALRVSGCNFVVWLVCNERKHMSHIWLRPSTTSYNDTQRRICVDSVQTQQVSGHLKAVVGQFEILAVSTPCSQGPHDRNAARRDCDGRHEEDQLCETRTWSGCAKG